MEVVLEGTFDIGGNHIALILSTGEVHSLEHMSERPAVHNWLLEREKLIPSHAEARSVKLRLIVIPTVTLEIPEHHALNVRFFLMEQKGKHFKIFIAAGNGATGSERIGEYSRELKPVIVAEFTDSRGLLFGRLVFETLLGAFGVTAIADNFVTGTERGKIHGIIFLSSLYGSGGNGPEKKTALIPFQAVFFYYQQAP